MEEPLSKDLGFGISARLDADGMLTLVEESTGYNALEEPVTEFTELKLPAQAARALRKLLNSPDGRAHMGARQLR